MARGINKVILIGNLGADPEVKYTGGGSAVANLRIATTESWKDRNTGEQVDRTEWHNIVLFGRTAEIAGEYLRKGSQIYIEGRLQTRKWQDKEGQDRYTTEVVGNDLQMLGGRAGGGGDFDAPAATRSPRPARSETAGAASAPTPSAPAGDPGFDDDIPF